MSPDVHCPYCNADNEICHDDGYGYEEGELHEQECGSCEKSFGFTTSISFDYEASKVGCFNGEPHQWKHQAYMAGQGLPDYRLCIDCGARDPGAYRKETK